MESGKLSELVGAANLRAEREQRLIEELTLADYQYNLSQERLVDAKNARADKILELREAGFTGNDIAGILKIGEQSVYALCRARERELRE
jgi:hypothetical protein